MRLRCAGWLGASALLIAATGCAPEAADPPASRSGSWPEPSPTRPVVDIAYSVAADLRTVTGTESVDFTPDLEICELVFRAWPNKPASAAYGSSLEVTGVRVDGVVARADISPAGAPAGAPGTLVEVPLPACVPAGTTVTAELGFLVRLGEAADERVGMSAAAEVAWFAGALPLLAWESGRGWAREPAVDVAGEMSTSEQFRLRSLEVEAPSGYDVLGTGTPLEARQDDPAGVTVHRFSAPAIRDIAVTVGDLDVLERDVGGVRLHLGAPSSGTRAPLEDWADQLEESLALTRDLLGPVPHDDLWISVLPDQTDGIEVGGGVYFGDVSPRQDSWLVTHEIAHLWFYGLVGNNQGRDPWLDEAFATFVQRAVDDDGPTDEVPRRTAGQVGRPMAYWATLDRPSSSYVAGVYLAGGAALLEARRQAGAEAFDAALRGYLATNAHRVAVPADVAEAFAGLPEVLEVLREAGALDGEG